jgi:hypothetical protein
MVCLTRVALDDLRETRTAVNLSMSTLWFSGAHVSPKQCTDEEYAKLTTKV